MSSVTANHPQTLQRVNFILERLKTTEQQREYAQERCITALTEQIAAAMQEQGISRQQVAERLGCTKGFVSQVLSGSRNMTLRTLADLFWAVGLEVNDVRTCEFGVRLVPSSMMTAVTATASPAVDVHVQSTTSGQRAPVAARVPVRESLMAVA